MRDNRELGRRRIVENLTKTTPREKGLIDGKESQVLGLGDRIRRMRYEWNLLKHSTGTQRSGDSGFRDLHGKATLR
jgi:hypothetical protein